MLCRSENYMNNAKGTAMAVAAPFMPAHEFCKGLVGARHALPLLGGVADRGALNRIAGMLRFMRRYRCGCFQRIRLDEQPCRKRDNWQHRDQSHWQRAKQ